MKQRHDNSKRRRQSGFSLIEMMIVLLVLGIVLAVVTDGLIQLQKRASADTGRVDMTQMARQFMDQMINDLHQVGYPGPRAYAPAYAAANPNLTAVGLISATPTSVEFEGDVDASGTVSHEVIQLLWSDGVTPVSTGAGSCPCILQRGIQSKALWGGSPPFYTEVTNVLLPVNSPGIFSYYTSDGTLLTPPIADLQNINVVKMTVNLQSTVPEADGTFPTITMASEAKINNFNH